MFTSAQALNQILSAASQHNKPKDNFIKVVAKQVGLTGPDAEPEIIRRLYLLVNEIKADIDGLPLDDAAKAHARAFVNPFEGLVKFSHVHMNIEQAKQHFLKPQNLVGLTTLHMILSGHTRREDLDDDTKNLSEEFRKLQDEILKASLPNDIKDILIKRTIQIVSILEHYYFFGPKALTEQLQALVGAMVVNPPGEEKEIKTLYQRLAEAVGKTFFGLEKVDRGLGATIGAGDKAAQLINAAQNIL